ncbi:amino acid ABC transporter substrate-binding protein (PAAT family) [Hypnocyclicus thermotrophus]|uniref:Amino acid ABC transporter substrate-binding protein (PAAT family) n=1 Tax=Hypnocyclicus thermotrophus TaxID=1627895 RepID=A0AA46DZK5_9FUSO|nr:amino acid ABC transporter substrate-binding protein [Hypnocyclicus thermotrophus]TDT71402.1 amino acid ABC transporter substrate-binding protein (PAAT family) [Hypnocyclicus thermotrophus]
MKKILLVVLVLFLGISTLGFSKDKVITKGKFVVGLDDTFAPMGFKDEKGNIVGFDIDLAKEAAKRMNLNVEFKPTEWSGIIFALKGGNIDVIWNGLTITANRKKQINFTKPYLANRQSIVILNKNNIKSKQDLKNKIIGLQLGSSADTAVMSDSIYKNLKNIKKYDSNIEALLDLEAGRIDAVVVDEIVARYYIAKKEKRENKKIYKVLNDDFGREEYGVGVRKGDKEFLDLLNKALDEMKKDGTTAKISKKWFGEDIVLK